MHNNDIEKRIFPPHLTVFGLTYPEWAIKWWQRMFLIPRDNNPAIDYTGMNSSYMQSGPIWFLAGTVKSSTVYRHCCIPAGKAILFPVINTERSTAELTGATTSQLIETAKYDIDQVSHLDVSINGAKIQFVHEYRIVTPQFDLKIARENFMGLKAGNAKAVSDGFWIILRPMPIGKHIIHFVGRDPNLQLDVSYQIQVSKVPNIDHIVTVISEEFKQILPRIHQKFNISIDDRDAATMLYILRAAIPSPENVHLLRRDAVDPTIIKENIDRLLYTAARLAKINKRSRIKPSDVTEVLLEMCTSNFALWPLQK